MPLDCLSADTAYSFATRSLRFMDAYRKGLNGRQAAWAAKKYRGHRVLPDTILDEFEAAHEAAPVCSTPTVVPAM
jgi:hypothetical protein